MYCVYGESGSSLLIESTDSMTTIVAIIKTIRDKNLNEYNLLITFRKSTSVRGGGGGAVIVFQQLISSLMLNHVLLEFQRVYLTLSQQLHPVILVRL